MLIDFDVMIAFTVMFWAVTGFIILVVYALYKIGNYCVRMDMRNKR